MLKRVYRYDVKGEGLNVIIKLWDQRIMSRMPETIASPVFLSNRLIFVQNEV